MRCVGNPNLKHLISYLSPVQAFRGHSANYNSNYTTPPAGLHTVGDVMKSAYKRAMLLRRHDDLAGSMYGVNCSAEELHSCRGDVCPNMEAASPNMGIKAASPNMGIKAVGCDGEVHVACYNSLSHVTIAVSGSDEEEAKFTGLTNKGTFLATKFLIYLLSLNN